MVEQTGLYHHVPLYRFTDGADTLFCQSQRCLCIFRGGLATDGGPGKMAQLADWLRSMA